MPWVRVRLTFWQDRKPSEAGVLGAHVLWVQSQGDSGCQEGRHGCRSPMGLACCLRPVLQTCGHPHISLDWACWGHFLGFGEQVPSRPQASSGALVGAAVLWAEALGWQPRWHCFLPWGCACLPSPGASCRAVLGPPLLAPHNEAVGSVCHRSRWPLRILFPKAPGRLLVSRPVEAGAGQPPQTPAALSSVCVCRIVRGFREAVVGVWCGVGGLVQGLALPLHLHLENGAHVTPTVPCPGGLQ